MKLLKIISRSKTASFFVFLIVLLCMYIGWHFIKYQLNVYSLRTYMENEKQFPEYKEVRTQFMDTLHAWNAMNLEFVENDLKNPMIIDELLLFDENRKRCTFVMHRVDIDSGSVFDYTKYIFAKKYNNSWHFFYGGMLVSPSYKTPGASIEQSLSEMSEAWHRRLCVESEFDILSCSPGNRIIDVWDTEQRILNQDAFMKFTRQRNYIIADSVFKR
jgi:hypothetical protein